MVLNWLCPPPMGTLGNCLDIFLVVATWGMGYRGMMHYWHLVGRPRRLLNILQCTGRPSQ